MIIASGVDIGHVMVPEADMAQALRGIQTNTKYKVQYGGGIGYRRNSISDNCALLEIQSSLPAFSVPISLFIIV